MKAPTKNVLTKKQQRQVEEQEAKARGLISEIVPLLHELPPDSVSEVSDHLDKALKQAKKAKDGDEETSS